MGQTEQGVGRSRRDRRGGMCRRGSEAERADEAENGIEQAKCKEQEASSRRQQEVATGSEVRRTLTSLWIFLFFE